MPLTRDCLPVSDGQTVYTIRSSTIEEKEFQTGMISELYFAVYSNALRALVSSINIEHQQLEELNNFPIQSS